MYMYLRSQISNLRQSATVYYTCKMDLDFLLNCYCSYHHWIVNGGSVA